MNYFSERIGVRNGPAQLETSFEQIPESGETHWHRQVAASDLKPGAYKMRLVVIDPKANRRIALPLANPIEGSYKLGSIELNR